uniref:Uncharacterized protein n=1 Tax=Siphoviridae sp. ctiOl67 TaxID=2825622 RepID=A0A8S5QJK7_9CAUD|nr:MAG TPA: hypothetical protein [Siphoviridae sp. ctiOl67]
MFIIRRPFLWNLASTGDLFSKFCCNIGFSNRLDI